MAAVRVRPAGFAPKAGGNTSPRQGNTEACLDHIHLGIFQCAAERNGSRIGPRARQRGTDELKLAK